MDAVRSGAMAKSRVADEICGGVPVCTWTFTAASEYKQRPRSGTTHPWFKRLATAFVPEGSVSQDYLEFQVWDSIQGLCSYVRGMLSSQAILRGVGVGSTAATTSSAIFHFFMRDFSGMLGGVLFAMFNGVGLDSHSKQWRLFADCFNNIGYALELLSPAFPAAFLLLACLGSIARAITGVAAGATRAALTQHFAQSGNAADISAKEGSQETAVTLVGMLLGMALVHLASGSTAAVWAVFLLLTALHIYANVRAMRSLRLTSLNRPRVDILLSSFMLGQKLPSVAGVAARESLLAPPLAKAVAWLTNARRVEVVLGARFSDLPLRPSQKDALSSGRLQDDSGRAQLLVFTPAGKEYFCWRSGRGDKVLVVLSPTASWMEVLRGYCEARCLAEQHSMVADGRVKISTLAAHFFDEPRWREFTAALESSGWDLGRISLGETEWRVAWERLSRAAEETLSEKCQSRAEPPTHS